MKKKHVRRKTWKKSGWFHSFAYFAFVGVLVYAVAQKSEPTRTVTANSKVDRGTGKTLKCGPNSVRASCRNQNNAN